LKFLNSNPNRKFRSYANKLWLYGYCNYTIKDLYNLLNARTPPKDIRGQFAYVYIDNNYWVACVDHFASTPLYYSNNTISENLKDLIDNTEILTDCKIFNQQKDILKLYTVGPFTRYNEIQMIMQEHMCMNGKQTRYMNFLNEESNIEPDYKNDYNIIENLCGNITNPVVSFSAGKDSAFIAMALKHFNKNPKLVKVHSDNVRNNIDIEATNDYEKIGWDIEKFDVSGTRQYKDDTFQFEQMHWNAGQFSVKRHAVKDKGDIALSGEVGGSTASKEKHFMMYCINSEIINIDDIIHFWINSCKVHFKDFTLKTMIYNGPKNDGYEYIMNFYRDRWNKLNKNPIEKIRVLFHIESASQRLWPESQDYMNKWFNIFADYDLQKSWLYLKPEYKKDKTQMLEIAKQFNSYTDISWNYKITGMAINAE